MSRLCSRTNHVSSLPLILLGAFLFICFAGTTQAFPWPWQSQKTLRDYSYGIGYTRYPVEIDSPVLGIHLGATYASGAIYRNGSVEMIPNKDGSRIIPNVVKFTDGKPLTGYDLEVDPAHTIFNMERLIGRKFNDSVVQEAIEHLPFKLVNVDNEPRIEIQVNSKKLSFSPQEISAIILGGIKKEAEEYLGAKVTNAVITVPADFDDAQRAATRDAGTLAGLHILRIVNEPTAAASAYNLNEVDMLETRYNQYTGRNYDFYDERNILVYNLGNHSFSASVLNVEEGVFEIKSNIRNFKINSTNFDSSGSVDTIALVEKALLEANMTKTDIHHIVITGGSADVTHMLEEHFGKAPLRDIDPDEVAAHGAAYQGYILSSDTGTNDGCYILDVNQLTLGIETSGGTLYPLIKRWATYPTKKTQYFTTAVDNQTTVLIQVYEGVRPYTNVSNFLGELELKGITPAKKGIPEIEVSFELDGNDMLRVTAYHMNNSIAVDILSHERRLSFEDIEKLVEEAERYYADDQEFDLRNEIESYAFHNGTRVESTKMRLVGNYST